MNAIVLSMGGALPPAGSLPESSVPAKVSSHCFMGQMYCELPGASHSPASLSWELIWFHPLKYCLHNGDCPVHIPDCSSFLDVTLLDLSRCLPDAPSPLDWTKWSSWLSPGLPRRCLPHLGQWQQPGSAGAQAQVLRVTIGAFLSHIHATRALPDSSTQNLHPSSLWGVAPSSPTWMRQWPLPWSPVSHPLILFPSQPPEGACEHLSQVLVTLCSELSMFPPDLDPAFILVSAQRGHL